MKRIFLFCLGCFSLAWVACAPAPMTTDGYDKACAAESDCTAVFVGNVCGCGCDAESIAKKEENRYSTEYSNRQKGCANLLTCAACPYVKSTCNSGKCVVVK